MDRIRIIGGARLNGTIPISGAKNATLPLMIASLLTEDTLILDNAPRLADVELLQRILGNHGVDVPVALSVAVVEWTGDEGHPKTSRLVPVSVYDGQVLQDGGIYLAQPAPLALSGEVEYELKENGKTVGLFDINGAGQEQGSWVGLGGC